VVDQLLPAATERIRFRRMEETDLDAVAALLGDPEVMAHYPAPKSRDEAAAWIAWSQRNYAEHGYGLWVIATPEGEFLGDCGLTWQPVGDGRELEVGYHLRPESQGRGLATEAAAACRDLAFDTIGVELLVAVIAPANLPSQGVARRIGMRPLHDDARAGRTNRVFGMTRTDPRP
jgi:RimJ/RimL family protein N-acetyltransferase